LVSWGVSGGYPICSFRQFLAKMYRIATIQNVTDDDDRRQTTDDRQTTCRDIGSTFTKYGRPKKSNRHISSKSLKFNDYT